MTKGIWGAGPQFTKATDDEIRKYLGSNTLPFYNSDSKIDLDLLYKNNDIASLKDILISKEKIRDNNSAYWTPTYKNRLNIEIDYLKSKIAGKKPKVTTIDTGTSAMKVAVAMQGDFNNLFKAKHLDGSTIGVYDTETVKGKDGKEKTIQKLRFQESLDRLNELIKNDEWLDKDNNRKLITMTAVRIPVQGLNSMEFMEVHHFLSPEAGNIIIPPTEIVAKSGADYDVDKLTTFMPNIDTDGRYVESLMSVEDLERIIKSPQVKDAAQAERIIKTHKAALENKLIESTRNILALPENYANLIRPNDTYLLKDIADELEPLVVDYDKYETSNGEGVRYDGKKKVISPTRMLEIGFNIHKQEVNMGGKEGLGLIALKNALHPIFSSIGARMPRTYKASVWNDTLKTYEEGDVDYDMTLKLKHNSNNGFISLSDIYDVDGIDRISDIFSHKMNGLVDVEKDSWIFNIQGNVEVLPVLSYLIMAGVPRQTAVYFVSQPLIRQYVERQRIMDGPYAKITGNTPSNNRSVKGQAALDVLENKIPLDVIQTANRLKLIDDVSINKANEFTVAFKADSKGVIKKDTVYSKEQLIKVLKNPESNVDNLASVIPAKSKVNIIKKVDANPTSTQNYYYTATAAAETSPENFDLDALTNLVDNNDTSSKTAIAAFTHFLEIEKQIEGLDALARVANPDTKTFKTIEEIIQREYDLETVAKSSKLDRNLVNKLRKDSILSEFFDNQLVKDLLEPLFILRNNNKVSKYITKVLNERRSDIASKFGFGEDNTRMFINQFKNAIVNYAYQNYMTNSIDSKGNIVNIPEMYNDLEVVTGTAPNGVRIEGDKMIVDLKVLESDYTNKKYEVTNLDKDNYTSRGLRPFAPADDLFQSKSSFFKYVMEREYLRSTNSIESLTLNNDYTDFLTILKKNITDDTLAAKKAYEVYLNQKALFNTFNRRALMVVEDYSFTNYFFNVINEFPVLKEKYPVLTQFTEPKIFSGEKVITLNNKGIVKGEIAENYYQNILDLANPQVAKVKSLNKEKDIVDNKRISELFQMLPLVSLYTNGIGYSKYGINKILPYDSFMDKIFEAGKIFTANKLNENTFDDIFYKLIKTNKSIFVDYVSPLTSTVETPQVPTVPLVSVTQTESGGLQFGQPPVMPGVVVEERITTQPISVTSNASQYTNHSGGAYGGDTFWDIIGREYGVTDQRHYKDAGNANLSQKLKNAGVTATILTKEQMDTARTEVERLLGEKYPDTLQGNLQVRNYYQVANADAVYAVAQLADASGRAIKSYSYNTIKGVTGGTNTAVQLAIKLNKPVYVWDLGLKTWFEWNGLHFTAMSNTPTLTKNFAGVGSRDIESYNIQKEGKWVPRPQYQGKELEEAAKQAIRDVYENTFKSSTQPSTSVNSNDIYSQLENKNVVISNIKTKDGKYDRDANIKKAKANNRVYTMEVVSDVNSFSNPWASFNRTGTIKTNTTKEAVINYIDWLTTDKFKDVKPQRKAFILDVLKSSKLKGRQLQYYAELGEPSHATALDYLINKYDWNTQSSTQSVNQVKEGVVELFEADPELANIGTPQQYTEWINYLTTQGKLAGTQATDILYHGTYENFEEFDEEKKGANTGINTYQSEDGSEQFYSDSAHTIFFSDRKTNAISYTLLGRDKYLSEISNALQDIRSGQKDLAQDAVEVLKRVPYFNNLIDKTKKEGKTTKEIIELLGKEETKLAKKYKEGSSSLFTNELAGYENSLKELNNFLSNLDVFKKGNNINFKNSTGNFNIFKKDSRIQFARFDKGRTVITGERFYADEVNNAKIKEFINDAIVEDKSFYNQAKINMKASGYEEKAISVLLNLQNPSIHDYEQSSFPDAYKNTKTRTAAFAAKQVADALKNGNDGVIYENIVDPLLSNSYGVFSTEQIYILSGKEDKAGFRNFVTGTTQFVGSQDSEIVLSNFYNTLTPAQKEKIGTLEDLYEEYNQIPYEQSVEDFIDEIKTCKL
jgi:hypothetical protein